MIEGTDCRFGAENWQMVDEDVFISFINHISKPTPKNIYGPTHGTISHIAYRIWSFYQWARKNGYRHFLDLDADEVKINISQQKLLAHINSTVTISRLGFNLPCGRPAIHEKEIQKFVKQSDFEIAVSEMDDAVYKVIAVIIRITGLRPKDLFQIPYRGTGCNAGFIPYDIDDIPDKLENQSIYFEFNSKGKRRSIQFPGKLWRVICELYIPIRRKRAHLYELKHGIPPRNNRLFLSNRGDIVSYGMLHNNFNKVVEKIHSSHLSEEFGATRFNARMLRHTCATYFVYEALEKQNRLGRHFVYDAALDEDLRKLLGHNDIKTTLEYYVHLVNRYVHDNLLSDLHRSRVDSGLNVILDNHKYFEEDTDQLMETV
ncbi:hypothetical protein ACNKU7_05650 [Microbulbifer sp. SA54]|uniref:hypothetical protein n=1 Tax=Microbulbifer sp. SA54 TaxID=3401577 RepID=UPI003AAF9C71